MASKKGKERDVTGDFLGSHRFVIKDYKFTEKQRDLIRLIRNENTKVVFLTGVAGTAKSFISIFCGLMALRDGSKKKMKYIRSLVESSKSCGFLPGTLHDKIQSYTLPLLEKLDEYLSQYDSTKLIQEGQIECLCPNFLRGTTMKDSFVIIDESQNLTRKELITIISRIGENSVLIFAGDLMQSDIAKSGFQGIIESFDDQESRDKGIHTFNFTADDIMRSQILRFIMGKIEGKADWRPGQST